MDSEKSPYRLTPNHPDTSIPVADSLAKEMTPESPEGLNPLGLQFMFAPRTKLRVLALIV